jgi:hypothetical protein
VISRAVLLLRVASGLGGQLIRESGIPKSDLTFWWLNVLAERGLWEHATPAPLALDLWLDVERALGDVASKRGTPLAYQSMNEAVAVELHALSGTERAGIWGIGM